MSWPWQSGEPEGPQLRQEWMGPKAARCLERLVVAQLKDMGDIDGFLSSFERACGLQWVPPADWLQELIPALNQEADGVLSQLEDLQPGDYNRVKEALLHKFGLTPEMYRKKFRGVQKGPRETYVDLASHLAQYGRKRVSGVGAQTAEELLMLVMMEQFYEVCPPKLRLWLKDRRPETPQEAGRLADEFTESRSGCEWESRRERESRRDWFSAERQREAPLR
ncbi:zinc finger protein with KRAB and SCAN domains 1-like [Pelodiscus sinensis]|uniref:zinc finger protein with KRAB and SCAN domains 1-like n=1 Tax=Pelodiscus sinensis TaxID=13735 RepID=UPI003F6B65AD